MRSGRSTQTSIDEVMFGHTNEPEYQKLAPNEPRSPAVIE
jgi:hypothetical protein